MAALSHLFIALVAILHGYFLVLEMFLWSKPAGLKAFRQSLAQAEATAKLAANQGLYNGFLAAGLVWALLERNGTMYRPLSLFFLGCVIVAGVYGTWSVNKKILFIQALPAAVALVLVLSTS
jgi:putative membrane protein